MVNNDVLIQNKSFFLLLLLKLQNIDGPYLIFFKEKHRLFMSSILGGENKSFKHNFNEKGVFQFRCHMYYPWVAGKVLVH
jgi:hypothetical protein